MVLPASSVRAAEPNETAGARHLADALGGSPNDFDLLHERMLEPEAGAALWSAKYVDSRTGEVHVVYRDPSDGAVAGQELATAHIAEATAQLTGCGPGAFCPYAAVRRDEMAAFLHRALAR